MAHEARAYTVPHAPELPTWTTRQVEQATGFTARHIYDLRMSGRLPAFKIGRSVRFRPSDVEALFVREDVTR